MPTQTFPPVSGPGKGPHRTRQETAGLSTYSDIQTPYFAKGTSSRCPHAGITFCPISPCEHTRSSQFLSRAAREARARHSHAHGGSLRAHAPDNHLTCLFTHISRTIWDMSTPEHIGPPHGCESCTAHARSQARTHYAVKTAPLQLKRVSRPCRPSDAPRRHIRRTDPPPERPHSGREMRQASLPG